ncbi:SpoIIE family protein phosphatase [Brevibacillus sp. NRS-1366]|uniref:SpoIIE family protein phosphatase n=1 Tax=Brevibacillus sp. NRS-1366 TaxID=3233899 RepID=UPI003D19B4C3
MNERETMSTKEQVIVKREPADSVKLEYKRKTDIVLYFSSFLIIFSILLVGTLVYVITEKEVVKKLKEKDMIYLAESVSTKIDEQIVRAKETTIFFAQDPAVYDWVSSGETKKELEPYAVHKLKQLVTDLDYDNSFIVSNVTKHYWAETGTMAEIMSENNPYHNWFFKTLKSKQKVTVNFDYNSTRNNTFVFVNTLMGEIDDPIAIVGIGFSLQRLANDFKEYSHFENSNLWLIDRDGNIYLSDNLDHIGTTIDAYMPENAKKEIREQFHLGTPYVIDYKNEQGQVIDLVSYPISSTDWKLIFQLPRQETVSFLKTIKYNTILSIIILLLAIIFLFYYVSRKITNPYQLALKVNQQLEAEISLRTREVSDKNKKLTDSIDYAKRIQEAILPDEEQLSALFEEHFLIWKPRDHVGGDFYWLKRTQDGCLFAIGDCTGHGVPGALMTILTISELDHIVERESIIDPSTILKKLNQAIKRTLKQETKKGLTDDGLDIGIIYFQKDNVITFSGAKFSLFIKNKHKLDIMKGNRKSIGYRRTDEEYEFIQTSMEVEPTDILYMTTDGYLDQNSENDPSSFGTKNFIQLIDENYDKPIDEQREAFITAMNKFMGNETQRDDITLFACRYHSK